jgi:hypothetical protein
MMQQHSPCRVQVKQGQADSTGCLINHTALLADAEATA